MHRRARLRTFALLWAVLQFVLPAGATIADAMAGAPSAQAGHVEAAPGRDCVPSHSPDCALCKHLSTSSLGSRHAPMTPSAVDVQRVSTGPVPVVARVLEALALPRAPPQGA